MSLERDTGKVYITYLYDMCGAMEVCEPRKLIFNDEKQLTVYTFAMTMNMRYTISKRDNKKYIHLVWYENDIDRTRTIQYARSEDEGKTWTKGINLVKMYKGESVPSLAIDTDSAEGGIFVQYVEDKVLKVLWSKDHGKTWEANITIANAITPYGAMSICGQTNNGKVFVMNHGLLPIAGNLNYFDAGTPEIKSLSYPFNGLKAVKNPTLHCSKGKKSGEFTLAVAVLDPATNEIVMTRGELIE